MYIDLDAIRYVLETEAFTGWFVEQRTSVSRQTISRIRQGKASVGNLKIEALESVQRLVNALPPLVGYDYSEMIKTLKNDDTSAYVQRGERSMGYSPIVKVYDDANQIPQGTTVEKTTYRLIRKEMEAMQTYDVNGHKVTLDQLMNSNYEGVEEGLYFEDYDLTVPLTNDDIDNYLEEQLGLSVEDAEGRLAKYALHEDEIDQYFTKKYLEDNQ